MSLVLDASMTLSLVLPDEWDEISDAVFAIMEQEVVQVPSLWHIEIRNALVIAWKRGRILKEAIPEHLAAIDNMGVSSPPDQDPDVVLSTALKNDLTVYDAAYLALAQDRAFALATRDRALRRAAIDCGVALVP